MRSGPNESRRLRGAVTFRVGSGPADSARVVVKPSRDRAGYAQTNRVRSTGGGGADGVAAPRAHDARRHPRPYLFPFFVSLAGILQLYMKVLIGHDYVDLF